MENIQISHAGGSWEFWEAKNCRNNKFPTHKNCVPEHLALALNDKMWGYEERNYNPSNC